MLFEDIAEDIGNCKDEGHLSGQAAFPGSLTLGSLLTIR